MDKERGPEPTPSWVLARQFRDATQARTAYEQARDLLLSEDLDASVFRITLSGASFVAVIGKDPPG